MRDRVSQVVTDEKNMELKYMYYNKYLHILYNYLIYKKIVGINIIYMYMCMHTYTCICGIYTYVHT